MRDESEARSLLRRIEKLLANPPDRIRDTDLALTARLALHNLAESVRALPEEAQVWEVDRHLSRVVNEWKEEVRRLDEEGIDEFR